MSIAEEHPKSPQDAFCQICKETIVDLNPQLRTQHVNRCIDQIGKKKLRTLNCPICGQILKTENSRRAHLKKCAVKFSVPIPQLMELIKKQEQDSQEQVQLAGHTRKRKERKPVNPQRTRKRTKKDLPDEPQSKFDEDIHLAIAMSISESSDKESVDGLKRGGGQKEVSHSDNNGQKQDLFSVMMSSSSALNNPLLKTKKKLKLQAAAQLLPLLALDQAVLQRRLEERVSDMVLSSSTNNHSSQLPDVDLTMFPSSRVQNKYAAKLSSGFDSEQKTLWNGSSSIKTSSNYYVEELAPYVKFEPASVQRVSTASRNPVSNADTTLYTSTQTAAVLAELASEIGDRTYNADETFATSMSVVKSEEGRSAYIQPLITSDGFCQQSAEDEVQRNAVRELLNSLETWVNNEMYSDLIIKCNSEQILHAHRVLLRSRCSRIVEIADENGIVHLEDFSKEAVLSLIRYLYIGDTNVSVKVVSHVQHMANRLHMSSLFCICDDIIRRNSNQAGSSISHSLNELPVDSVCDGEASVIDDFDHEMVEVCSYLATQRRRHSESNDNDSVESDKSSCEDDDNEVDEEDAVDRLCSPLDRSDLRDDNVFLSQALLSKLEETFASSGDVKKRDVVVNKRIKSPNQSMLSLCSVDSGSGPKRESDVEHCVEMSVNDDPCDGYYDRIDVQEEKRICSGRATYNNACGETLPSTYSAASPMSLFDDNDEYSLKSPDRSVTHAVLQEDSLPVSCTSPDDLFDDDSPSAQTSSWADTEKFNSSSARRSLSERFNNIGSETSIGCVGDLGNALYHSSSDDALVKKDTSISKEAESFEFESIYRCKKGSIVRATDTSPNSEIYKRTSSREISRPKSCTGTPRAVVESKKSVETDRLVTMVDSDFHCSQRKLDSPALCLLSHKPIEDVAKSDIIIIDDDTNSSELPSIHGVNVDFASVGKAENGQDTGVAFSPVCEGDMLNEAACEYNVWDGFDEDNHVAYMYGQDEPSSPFKTPSAVFSRPSSSSKNIQSSTPPTRRLDVSRSISCRKMRTPSPIADTHSRNLATSNSLLSPMSTQPAALKSSVSLSKSPVNTTPKKRILSPIADTHFRNSATPKSLISRVSNQPAALKSSVSLSKSPTDTTPKKRTSSPISGTHFRNSATPKSLLSRVSNHPAALKSSVSLSKSPTDTTPTKRMVCGSPELGYSPPTDMDTDVSAVMDQFLANEDESFETVRDIQKTPVVPNRKIIRKNTLVTPLPDYQTMITPDIKIQCSKYGVRALPKKVMIKVLEQIYYGTHPTVEKPEVVVKGKAIRKKVLSNLSSKTGYEQMTGAGLKKMKKQTKSGSNDQMKKKQQLKLSERICSEASSSTSSFSGSSKIHPAFRDSDTSFDDESDRQSVPEESLMYSPEKKGEQQLPKLKELDEKSKKKLLQDYIKSNEELYKAILLYQSLEIDEFVTDLKTAGIKLPIKDVINFLDEQNILYTTRNSRGGWASRNKGAKRQRRYKKGASSKVTSSQTAPKYHSD